MSDAIATQGHMLPAVEEAIQKIVERDGHSTTEALIDYARPESSPIHPAFEWDDRVAGEEWRKVQSRQWHRQARVIIGTPSAPDPVSVRLVHVPAKDDNVRSGWYVPMNRLRQDEDMFQRALRFALNSAAANLRAVQELLDAAGDDKDRIRVAKEVERGALIMAKALELVK